MENNRYDKKVIKIGNAIGCLLVVCGFTIIGMLLLLVTIDLMPDIIHDIQGILGTLD